MSIPSVIANYELLYSKSPELESEPRFYEIDDFVESVSILRWDKEEGRAEESDKLTLTGRDETI